MKLPPRPLLTNGERHWMLGSYIPTSTNCKERDITEFLVDLAYIGAAIAAAVVVVIAMTKF